MTYKISDDSKFAIEGDNTLTVNTVFDYEQIQSAQFVITATDPEGLSASQTFSIEVWYKWYLLVCQVIFILYTMNVIYNYNHM